MKTESTGPECGCCFCRYQREAPQAEGQPLAKKECAHQNCTHMITWSCGRTWTDNKPGYDEPTPPPAENERMCSCREPWTNGVVHSMEGPCYLKPADTCPHGVKIVPFTPCNECTKTKPAEQGKCDCTCHSVPVMLGHLPCRCEPAAELKPPLPREVEEEIIKISKAWEESTGRQQIEMLRELCEMMREAGQ